MSKVDCRLCEHCYIDAYDTFRVCGITDENPCIDGNKFKLDADPLILYYQRNIAALEDGKP